MGQVSAPHLGLYAETVDRAALERTVRRFQQRQIRLPTFAELAYPGVLPNGLSRVGPDDPHPANLFRVHWYNDSARVGQVDIPGHIVLPGELTGVESPILVALGDRFPMVGAHKVLAAYACLVPRVVCGAFDPTRDRAIWPSTGNYARGGVAISRLMGCRGAAVLPEGMSRERFEWLEAWTDDPQDLIRTPGTESNVKEIYDVCNELRKDPANVILNQFAELGNHLVHYQATGAALERIVEANNGGRLTAFVAASGSAGTLGAGDYLKERYGSRIVAAEAFECPTMLYNGYGEHNIQGIGDKHIPLIHNVGTTDDAVAITDRATDALLLVFNTRVGREALSARGLDPAIIAELSHLGLSSICNVLAAIRTARHHHLGGNDVIITVATDGADMYRSEVDRITRRDHPGGYTSSHAEAAIERFLAAGETGDFLELGDVGRRRVFNLGYYTWVEQQGISGTDFEARRDQQWWRRLRPYLETWDAMITDFNERTGVRY